MILLIKNFNPKYILPETYANLIRSEIQIEILDALSSKRKSKTQGNNPNLEKVNRLKQQKNYGLVFITNAEKVVLEKIDYTPLLNNLKEENEVIKINQLREALSQFSNLSVILDEVHHVYGKTNNNDKKLRQAIDILNQYSNVSQVVGVSGTPYIKSSINIGNKKININTIQDIVYYYPLNEGIGKFLKIPNIKSLEAKDEDFINKSLDDFFSNYDKIYNGGIKSKIAFYSTSIESLNKEILPTINKWYDKNRKNNKEEIFVYYSCSKQYPLPKDSTAVFHNLDKPYSKKRVILLVAIGTEGWDCKSLTAVALPRRYSTKNFVLQTTCRCLREVDDARNENALIYLSEKNYEILNNQLKENYKISIADLKIKNINCIPIKVRKPKITKLKYKQVEQKCSLTTSTTIDISKALKTFDFNYYIDNYNYSLSIKTAKIARQGLINEIKENLILEKTTDIITRNEFLYKISNALYGITNEAIIYQKYGEEIEYIYNEIVKNYEWINKNPNLSIDTIINDIASCFTKKKYYKK